MSDGEKSGPDRGMSDRQKSLGKCAIGKGLIGKNLGIEKNDEAKK